MPVWTCPVAGSTWGFLLPLLPGRCGHPPVGGAQLPDGIEAAGARRLTVFYGRRGKPLNKPRFMPAELAHGLARKLQAKGIGTVSVL